MENKDEKNLSSEVVENSENVSENQLLNQSETSTEPKEVKKESAADVILRKLAESKKRAQENAKPAEKLEITEDEVKKDTSKTEVIKEEPVENSEQEEKIVYSHFGIPELVDELKRIVEAKNYENTKDNITAIKTQFYKLHNTLAKEEYDKFVEGGGEIEQFEASDAKLEEEFKNLLKDYKDAKAVEIENQEKIKKENLLKKQAIIDEMGKLINLKEDFNKIYDTFRDLQNKWNDIGLVPVNDAKDLWDNYHRQIEEFYEYAKINKELRDLDLKKNKESKIQLCERAEELMLKDKVVEAFRELQVLHDRWREIGPVPRENKEELWERFKNATKTINKRHQDYFEQLKQDQENNLKAKELLTEEANRINELDINDHKEWEKQTQAIIELQKIWRLIGFAPKKFNNKIYHEFRNSCDAFFERKREFYSKNKEQEDRNLQQKIELCQTAESLKESTDWQKTSETLKRLQRDWKKIGPVSRKDSDAVWKRFRSACNTFFEKKQAHYNFIEQEQEGNLKLKLEVIEKLKAFEITDDKKENLAKLKDMQKEWTEIGYVPFDKKDQIYDAYKAELDRLFEGLKIDEKSMREMKMKQKLEEFKQMPRNKVRAEKDKIRLRIDKMLADIQLWENNLGFFAKSKNAESMIRDFSKKIEQAKDKVKLLRKELREINDIEKEQ